MLAFPSLSVLFRLSKIRLIIAEYFPPASAQWSTNQIGDLSGKVALITGANTGIGLEAATVLALHGAKVYVAARSEAKGKAAVEQINTKISLMEGPQSGEAVFLLLDLADLQSVKNAVDEFIRKETRLDILLNSGGVMMPPEDTKRIGLDLQFATNVLGHFALTRLLISTLIRSAKSSPDGTVRVITMSSSAQLLAPLGGIRFDKLSEGSRLVRYAQSKLANIVFANELARRYTNSGIISASLSPGNIQTELWRHQRRAFFAPNTFIKKFPVSLGVLTPLYLAASPEVSREDSGSYYIPWAKRAEPLRDEAVNPLLATKLWDWCEQELKCWKILT